MKKPNSILIIGAGKVGTATGISLGSNVDYHDPNKGIENKRYNDYRAVIICVDTVQTGPADYLDLESVFRELDEASYKGCVAIRSTVSPHKIREWDANYSINYIMFPEFLPQQENRLITDNAWIVVLGGASELTRLFASILYSHGYPAERSSFLHVSKTEACIIKLGNNAGLASKLTYFNAIYAICEKYDASYDLVRVAIGRDKRIGIEHSIVPSPDDGLLGFGGHCLPKDLVAIAEIDSLGYFAHVAKINSRLRNVQ